MTDGIPEIDSTSSTGIPIHGNDIDTDQIIPVQFIRVVTFDGPGGFAFFDQHYDENDEPKDHPLSEPQFQDASIMAVNASFDRGSSREHAPQTLMRWDISAIVDELFAEIFVGNCLVLGIPMITADHETVAELQDQVNEHLDGDIDMGVESETVTYGDTTVDVTVDDVQQEALIEDVWNTTALMKSSTDTIAEKATALPYVGD